MTLLTETETRWLGYAERVITCPEEHRRGCVQRGAAFGRGIDGGNDLRFPGYLGCDYKPEQGVLFAAHVHREPQRDREFQAGESEEWIEAHHRWALGRSTQADAEFLAANRRYYEATVTRWGPWDVFGPIANALGIGVQEIAYMNLAKCRLRIDRSGAIALARFCQQQFRASELIEAIRPNAVFVCVLSAAPDRGEVIWTSPSWKPMVFAFHRRRRTDTAGRPWAKWLPAAVESVQQRLAGRQ